MNITTDDAVLKIVTEVGIAIPYYDYNKRKFVTNVPVNININNTVVGSFELMKFDTFRYACMIILYWHDENL